MADTFTYIGDLTDDLLYAALTPDGSTLYAFELNRGFTIRSYTYPGLSGGSTVVSNVLGPMTMDDSGVLYWTDDAVSGSTAATQIWKNASSPTLLWSSAYGAVNPTVNLCWSPYDGLLYAVIDLLLYSIHPTTGTATLVYTPTSGTVDQLYGPTPTLDGGIWWAGVGGPVYRYDIPTATGVQASTAGATPYRDVLIPKADGTTLGLTSSGTVGWTIAADLTATLNTGIAGLVGGIRGVAYKPDLSLIAFGDRGSNGVWQYVGAPRRRFWVGTTGFSR